MAHTVHKAPSINLFGPPKDTSGEKKDAAPTTGGSGLFGAPKPADDKKDTPAGTRFSLDSLLFVIFIIFMQLLLPA